MKDLFERLRTLGNAGPVWSAFFLTLCLANVLDECKQRLLAFTRFFGLLLVSVELLAKLELIFSNSTCGVKDVLRFLLVFCCCCIVVEVILWLIGNKTKVCTGFVVVCVGLHLLGLSY